MDMKLVRKFDIDQIKDLSKQIGDHNDNIGYHKNILQHTNKEHKAEVKMIKDIILRFQGQVNRLDSQINLLLCSTEYIKQNKLKDDKSNNG